MMKFKIGDTVKVTGGKDKGVEGQIEKIDPKKNTALIPEVNVYKKHVKGISGKKGGIYDIPRPLPFSNIALVCPSCKKVTRVGFRSVGDKKARICSKCGREINVKKRKTKSKKKK